MRRAVIQGTGHCVPDGIVTNHDLTKLVETSDEWITQRTGISERRACAADESAGDLSIKAALEALEASKVRPEELDLVIVATVCGDYTFPSTACIVQDAIGAKNAGAFDVGAACAGFIYGLATATAFLESNAAEKALVVGVDTLTKFVDWSDRSTCILFGDAAGAAVVGAESGTDRGVIKTVMLSDGSGAKHIIREVGGSRMPTGSELAEGHSDKVFMNGSETYRFAVNALGDACLRCLKEAGMQASEIDLFVPHQANVRIIDSAAEKIGLPPEKVFKNIQYYGNTSAGSIPLGLYEAERDGRLKTGDVVMTVGFGAGLVWGANLIRW